MKFETLFLIIFLSSALISCSEEKTRKLLVLEPGVVYLLKAGSGNAEAIEFKFLDNNNDFSVAHLNPGGESLFSFSRSKSNFYFSRTIETPSGLVHMVDKDGDLLVDYKVTEENGKTKVEDATVTFSSNPKNQSTNQNGVGE